MNGNDIISLSLAKDLNSWNTNTKSSAQKIENVKIPENNDCPEIKIIHASNDDLLCSKEDTSTILEKASAEGIDPEIKILGASNDALDSSKAKENREGLKNTENMETSNNDKEANILRDIFNKAKYFKGDKERTNLRNEINDKFILNTAVEINEENIATILERGDFFIARRIWNKEEGKFHDHFVFVKERSVLEKITFCRIIMVFFIAD